ncbi:hypothetical protein RD792_000750 [Penstemon davidsonii]|uniref:mitogen-activated protein kinase kinase kinase n=1 Tax=Penstemon davidsonii TaxID=160366 RepID=A0ABR0DLV2_9LAMI|nr:hypothetical protein RD792_000750 [Penstemon davidsonii]
MDPASTSSRHQVAKPKPRLDRRNAAKNINYEFSSSSTSSSTSTSSSYYSSEESLRTRSLDLYGDKRSFRIDGVEGEIEIICKTLGFSGVDEFGIPPEEYEAMKVRSSSAPLVLTEITEPLLDREIGKDYNAYVGRSSDLISTKCEEIRDLGFYPNYVESNRPSGCCGGFGDSVRVRRDVSLSDTVSGRLNENRANGINGVRPPVLAPPPLMSLPVIDRECSTWDMLRAFAPDSDTVVSRLEDEFYLDEDGEENEEVARKRNEGHDKEDRRERVMRREDKCVLAESDSFTTTSNDDDSSSSSTDPVSSISPNGRSRRDILDWQKGELLGRGSFGSVYEGIADDGFFFAVKEVSLLDQGDEGKQSIIQLEQEIALLSQFQHENIVQYYGTKKDDSRLYIFLELVTKGSLLSLYQKYYLRDSQVSAYTRQILHGLKYLHDRDVVHRDIKCANILVDTNGLVKLADFGLAKATKLNDVKSCKGTAFWMAPEVVRSRGYGLAADIWSLGCTVLEMLTRRFPYSNLDCMEAALYRIGKGERPDIPNSLSNDARDFILKCLQVDPSLRPTAAQLLDHPLVKRSLPQA